ncbi:MAG: phage integrase N-terminal SAM-like domain-containing protein [Cyanobacteria bacterium]|nr:phage integrase N-terminal SAM-like domain-containing protein [Cyanobacteria bacterium bin.51]
MGTLVKSPPRLRPFLRFHQLRHPQEMGGAELNDFLSHLAVERQVAGLPAAPAVWPARGPRADRLGLRLINRFSAPGIDRFG